MKFGVMVDWICIIRLPICKIDKNGLDALGIVKCIGPMVSMGKTFIFLAPKSEAAVCVLSDNGTKVSGGLAG